MLRRTGIALEQNWLICLALVTASCSGGEGDPNSLETSRLVHGPAYEAPPQTAGAEDCMDCHGDLVADWSRTGMARSLQAVEPGELDGLGVVADGPDGYLYQFARTPDRERHVLGETRTDTPGHALGSMLVLGIGSAERDRSYVAIHGRGMWFAPVEVLSTAHGRRAVLAPGAMMSPGTRLTMPITPECLGCHTDAPPPRTFPLNSWPDPATWQPRGISCAACHGASAAHAGWQEGQLSGENPEGTDPILRHGELDRWAQLSVCAACHLQGDARLVLDPHQLGPPAPGGDLLEQRALFVAAEPSDEVGFVSQVERLVLSRCFIESEMTCTTCHDPHRTLHEDEERERVRAACARCHPGEGPTRSRRGEEPSQVASACSREMREELDDARDCVGCHMPRTGVFDVAEITIHDHYIRTDGSDARLPSGPDALRFAESATGDWQRFRWPGTAAPAHVDDPGLWMMALAAGQHLGRALARADEAPGPTAAGLPMYHHVRGSLLESNGRPEEAAAAYEHALELDPELAPSAINLGLLLGQLGRGQEGREHLDAVIERYPFSDGALRNRAVLRHEAGDLQGFVDDLTRAFDANPRAKLAGLLAEFFAGRGDGDSAQRWRELARRLDPLASRSAAGPRVGR
jgi:predicted CXXCH cytochrome family protein